MQLIRSLDDYRADAPLALAIGNFDGLHCGHQAVIAQMQAVAEQQGLLPAILTFEPHPRRFFAPSLPGFRLQTLHDKLGMLRAMGVQRVFALRFNAAMAGRTAEQFLRMLRQQMGVQAVITGENFVFGKDRAGDMALLRAWGREHGMQAQAMAPVTVAGEACSSTRVRDALAAGNMGLTAALLGRAYSLGGRVRHGDKRGRELGYPTANILPSPVMKLPRYGVYAVTATCGARRWQGVANLGVRPSVVHAGRPQLEVHLFEMTGDLYGQRLRVDFHAHLRDEKRFDSLPALTHQIALDAQQARQRLKESL